MQKGWISLHRSIQDNELWLSEPFTKAQAWVDLLLLSNHKPQTIFKRGIAIKLNRGEVGWSEAALADRWRWSREKVRNFLNYLKTVQQIDRQTNKTLSRIIIINYDKYQVNQTTDRTTDRTNDNNVNNVNKKETSVSSSLIVNNPSNMKYIPVDEDGNPMRRKKPKAVNQNKDVVLLGFKFQEMGEKATGVKPDLTNAYFKIKQAMKTHGLTTEDALALFKHFFNDSKLTPEQHVSLGFCISGSYITQWKVAKQNKPISQLEASSEIMLWQKI